MTAPKKALVRGLQFAQVMSWSLFLYIFTECLFLAYFDTPTGTSYLEYKPACDRVKPADPITGTANVQNSRTEVIGKKPAGRDRHNRQQQEAVAFL